MFDFNWIYLWTALSGIQNVKVYTYKELKAATDNFCLANKIGEGGFGSVYKVTKQTTFKYCSHHCMNWLDHYFFLPFFYQWNLNYIMVDNQGLLKDGKVAAIKVLSAESRQGVKEFMTEIDVISGIEHENLVKLYGCCVEDNHRILVYNYLENNSLAQTLLGKCIIIFC